jgi:hypothetical protein
MSSEQANDISTEFGKSEITVCAKCCFHVNKDPDSPRADIWYNNVCSAVENEKGVDFTTGKETYFSVNDLGDRHATDDAHPPCRKINTDGHCKLYMPLSLIS